MHVATLNPSPTKNQIHLLAKATGPCLSLFLRPAGAPATQALRLRNLIDSIHAQVDSAGLSSPAIDALLAPAQKAIEERFELSDGTGIAVYSSASGVTVFGLTGDTLDQAFAGNSFHIAPLIDSLGGDSEFHLLALSQKHTRLIHCTRTDSAEVDLPAAIPTNLSTFNNLDAPDHRLENRSPSGHLGGGHIGLGVAFGTGADKDKEYLHNFFHEIDKQLLVFLHDSSLPVILAGVDYELAMYHKLSKLTNLLPGGVTGSPDSLKGGELHARALATLDQHNETRAERALAIHGRAPGQRIAALLGDIATAAADGRIATLFLATGARIPGAFDATSRTIVDTAIPGKDLCNWLLLQTYAHSGDAFIVPRDKMPGHQDVAAYLRY